MDDNGKLLPPFEPGLIYCRQEAYPEFTYINRDADRKAIDREGLVAVGDIGYFDREGYLARIQMGIWFLFLLPVVMVVTFAMVELVYGGSSYRPRSENEPSHPRS